MSIRVHLLSSGFRPLNATITENELQVLFERVNETWEPAHITWDIDSIIREEALNSGDFKRLLQGELPASGQIVASVIPRGNLFSGKWDVFLILDLAGIAGGFFFPSIPAVLSAEVDPLGNRDLTGSAARILAHELGHSLSLQHVPCTPEGNLMAPACEAQDRTRLTATQIKAARRQAETGSPFTLGGAIGSSE